MNLLEKLNAIDAKKIQRNDLQEQLHGVIAEYDEKDQDSVDNAQTILDILEDLYPGILPSEKKENKEKEGKEKENKDKEVKEGKEKEGKDEKGNTKEEHKKSSDQREAVPAKVRKKITKEDAKSCTTIVSDIQTVLNRYKASRPRVHRKKKPLSVLVKDNVVSIIKRVVHKHPKKEINEAHFEEMVKNGKLFLKSIRKFSGGINEQVIHSFEKQMNEILESFNNSKAA